jgi:hypothetical protein
MNIHYDASYLSEAKACSQTCGYFVMGRQPKDGKPIHLSGAFHVCAKFSVLLWPPLPKLNSALCTTIARLASYLNKLSKQWVTCNPRCLCIATMPLWWGLQITQLNASICAQWKCASSGSVTKLHRICTHSAGILAKRTWLIAKVSITWAPIMWLFALGTYIWIIPPGYSQGP